MVKPCKYLDYDKTAYGQACELIQIGVVKYWWRKTVPYEGAPREVQFCGQGRGRIDSILACYTGVMACYEPGPDDPDAGRTATARHAPTRSLQRGGCR